jgi:SprT protein
MADEAETTDHANNTPALMRQARARTLAFLERARQLTGHALPCPAIRFDLRGRSAGQVRIARDGTCTIRYNARLLERHPEDFLHTTVAHEVAHYAAYARYGRNIRPHGPQWQDIMRALGADPSRCHDYDTEGLDARRLRRHVYHCACGEHLLTSIRHNRVRRGTRYFCRRCGEALRPEAGDRAGRAR